MKPKTNAEIAAIRESGQMLKNVRDTVAGAVRPGMTTKELANLARDELKQLGGKPAFLGYMGFPDVICISVNEQVVHGIPSELEISAGDLVSLDYGVEHKGMMSDSAVTVVAGGATPSGRVRTLLKATEEALYAGIDQVKPGMRIGDISHAIQVRLLRDNLGIVEELVGHGIGHEVHEEPEIPNFGTAGTGPTLKAGQTIAIEPMATLGDKAVFVEADGWTVSSRDGSLSAHFEHTVLVTDDGYEILT